MMVNDGSQYQLSTIITRLNMMILSVFYGAWLVKCQKKIVEVLGVGRWHTLAPERDEGQGTLG